jgi:type IV secretory pathway TraG/TraD family ATPase VirD4
MQTPLVAILDEAANVCRWPDLPDLYSHFGSRGIPIMSVFQSYSQGVAVFGKEGMEKLRSASNVFIYAGGVRENDFLKNLSELVGTYDREASTESFNKGVRSTSTSLKREPILEVDELANLPRGYAVMLSSGARAAMLRTIPWFRGPKKQVAAIKASIAAHDPSKQPAVVEETAPAAAAGPTATEPTVEDTATAVVEDSTVTAAGEDTSAAADSENVAPATAAAAGAPAAEGAALRDLLRTKDADTAKDRADAPA